MAQQGLCDIHLSSSYDPLPEVLKALGLTDDAQLKVAGSRLTDDAVRSQQAKQFAFFMGAADENGKYDALKVIPRVVGYFRQKTLKADGTLKKQLSRDLGMDVALAKNVMAANAQGAKELAERFLAKSAEGQDALTEASAFMKMFDGLTEVAQVLNQGSLELGGGLRMLRKQDVVRYQAGIDESMVTAVMDDAVDQTTEAARTAFEEIAAMMNAGDTVGGLNKMRMLAKRMTFAENPLDVIRMARGARSFPERVWMEVMMNGLLSSPTTMVTNAMGLAWAVARPTFQLLAAGAFDVATFGNSQSARLAAIEATAKLAGMYGGFQDAVKIGWNAAVKERALYGNTTVSGSMQAYQGPALTVNNIVGQIENFTGNRPMEEGDSMAKLFDGMFGFLRIPSRVMLGSDEMVKHIAMRGEAAAMGIRRAYQEGGIAPTYGSSQLKEFVEKEVGMAFNGPQMDLNLGYEYAARIKQYADYATFQEANRVAQGINNAIDGLGPAGTLLRPLFPFIRTPLNILKQGIIESTGVDAAARWSSQAIGRTVDSIKVKMGGTPSDPLFGSKASEAIFIRNLEAMGDPSEGYRVMGQMAVTASLIGFFYTQAMAGNITGGGPARWEDKSKGYRMQEIWLKAGNVPYSIKIPGTDQVIAFDRLGEPLSNVMRIVTDMAMFSAYATEEEQDNIMMGLTGVAITGLYQQSFLTGVRNVIQAMTEDNADGDRVGRLTQNYVAAMMPMGGMLNFAANVTDPYKTVYEGSTVSDMWSGIEGGFGTIFNRIGNRMPGRSGNPIDVDQVTGTEIPSVPGFGPRG